MYLQKDVHRMSLDVTMASVFTMFMNVTVTMTVETTVMKMLVSFTLLYVHQGLTTETCHGIGKKPFKY